jgi:UDP-N-acetylmuramoylalanine--D-glutamate ligase
MDRNESYVREQLESDLVDVTIYSVDNYLKFDQDVDIIFKSPGIPLKDLEGFVDFSKLTSQSNEFIKAFGERIIGITGTKGKSTTATLTYYLMKAEGVDVELVGNIGKPAFDYIKENEIPYYVYELSSHQLETVKVSPKYSVVLNIFEEHLDHYHSFDHYAEAKMNIARHQSTEDYFIYSTLSNEIPNRTKGFQGKACKIITDDPGPIGITVTQEGIKINYNTQTTYIENSIKRHLQGDHNMINIASAVLLTQMVGCDEPVIRAKVIENFEGLPHRLAYVATIDEVAYYNDSISTIPQATIAAISALNSVDTVIIGGMDRGIDYKLLIDYINDHPLLKVVLLPYTGHKLMPSLFGKERLFKAETMEEAVGLARQVTEKGKACLLSPASASYGFYKNFEERGKHFEALISKLSEI